MNCCASCLEELPPDGDYHVLPPIRGEGLATALELAQSAAGGPAVMPESAYHVSGSCARAYRRRLDNILRRTAEYLEIKDAIWQRFLGKLDEKEGTS